jgi:hypothetical protein
MAATRASAMAKKASKMAKNQSAKMKKARNNRRK